LDRTYRIGFAAFLIKEARLSSDGTPDQIEVKAELQQDKQQDHQQAHYQQKS